MNKWQAQYSFWSSFGVPAYDAASVPTGDNAPEFPYITYTAMDALFDGDVIADASVWTREFPWATANELSDEIRDTLKNGGKKIPYDGGLIWITANEPFAQDRGDPSDDLIKRKLLSVTLHFY